MREYAPQHSYLAHFKWLTRAFMRSLITNVSQSGLIIGYIYITRH